MRQEIELYLGGRSVEFAEPPEILFSYIRTDYTDPTVLRNSYSKTLTIEGTPNNNRIFNSIYHLDQEGRIHQIHIQQEFQQQYLGV